MALSLPWYHASQGHYCVPTLVCDTAFSATPAWDAQHHNHNEPCTQPLTTYLEQAAAPKEALLTCVVSTPQQATTTLIRLSVVTLANLITLQLPIGNLWMIELVPAYGNTTSQKQDGDATHTCDRIVLGLPRTCSHHPVVVLRC